MKEYTQKNAEIINEWKARYGLRWMNPISHEDYLAAQSGKELLTLTPVKKVPLSWYRNMRGKKVLGLAAGGGQQMAILSALGAECTLLDITTEQINADRAVSEREGYHIEVIQGDMTEPLPFADGTFDIVINPVSNHYIEEVAPVFGEIYRVLKKGGVFLAGLDTGIYWAFDEETKTIKYPLPFNPLKDKEIYDELIAGDLALCFSHTLEEQIGLQLKLGFRLDDIYEDTNGDGLFEEYHIPTFIATKATK